MRERRTKLFFVDPDCLLTYLKSMEHWPQCFGRAILKGIPDNAELEGVRFDEGRRCLAVLVWCQDWPIVPDGEPTPIAEGAGYFEIKQAWFVRQEDGSYLSLDDKQQAMGNLSGQLMETSKPTKMPANVEKTEAQKIADGDYRDRRYDFPPLPAVTRPIPVEILAAESSQYGNKDAEADFFRKSILAE